MRVIKNQRLRKTLRILLPFVAIPAAVAAGMVLYREKSYTVVAAAVACLAILLFVCGFEKKTVGTRRLVIVAVMTALSVAGRFAFAAIPAFKPITAIVIITAVYLGGEAGFLVGALSALISNFYFGQGPWTPFQMFAWGMIGFAAGLFALQLKKSKIALSVYAVISAVGYSLVMDLWTVLWYNGSLNPAMYLASAVSSLPFMAIYAVSNVVFLLLLAKPFGEKLERVKIKYGV